MFYMETIKGNILDLQEGIIIHQTNCLGKFGSGIALTIKEKYPKAFDLYRQQYEESGLVLGEIQLVGVLPNLYIVNANGQSKTGTYQQQTDYHALRKCFKKVNKIAEDFVEIGNPLDVCFPLIGCGLGGGSWDVVSNIIKEELSCNGYKAKLFVL